jgi:hypothetical protein
MKDYHERSLGRVAVQKLLEAGNIAFRDLPFLTNLVDTSGKNWLCYNHCLGVCQHGRSCVFKRKGGHVDGKDLPAQFTRELIAKISPGLKFAERTAVPACAPSEKSNATVGNNPAGKKRSGA